MRVLAVGAHPDDIELGCGASLALHRASGHEVTLLLMTAGDRGPQLVGSRADEQEAAARLLQAELLWAGFEDGSVPADVRSIDAIQEVIDRVRPDVVYGHAPDDTHQDHRATSLATMAAARRIPRVLLFSTPSTRTFNPTMFVNVDGFVETKTALLRAHESQLLLNDFVDIEEVEAAARYWGFKARVPRAEAFETSRFTWNFTDLAEKPVHVKPAPLELVV